MSHLKANPGEIRPKPECLEQAVTWVMAEYPKPKEGYSAFEMLQQLEKLGWDFNSTWLDVHSAMTKVFGQPGI